MEAETFVLVAVAIAALGKALAAESAGERAQSFVRAHVVLHVAQLGELFAARQALKHLVLSAGFFVQILDFFEALFSLELRLRAPCYSGHSLVFGFRCLRL